MIRGSFRGNPIAWIILALIVMSFIGYIGPIILDMLEFLLPLLALGIIVLVAMALAGVDPRNLFGSSNSSTNNFAFPKQQNTPPQPENVKRREAANKAVSRAGFRPGGNADIDLADIGLLVYEGNDDPIICRLSDVPTNASHIRPFIFLDLPNLPESGGNGVIRFNLVDGSGKLRFTSRMRYTVKRGQNFITPKTWLPLADQVVDGAWSLQVCIGDAAPFAIHEFEWLRVGGEVRAHFNGDGEIDELMQPAVSHNADETISLDELLADQGEVAPAVMTAKQ